MMKEEDRDHRVELSQTTARRLFQRPANSPKVPDPKTRCIGSRLINRRG